MTDPRVLIVYNEPVLPPDHPDYGSESDVLYSAKIVRESLTALGIPNASFGVTDDLPALLARLLLRDFDVVFNLYEGTADFSITEVYFTGLLEWLRMPYTGCPSTTLGIARNKALAKQLFKAAGIRTPDFVLLHDDTVPPLDLGWPLIVKPVAEDASVGIDQGSVVSNEEELLARVKYVRETYGGSVLVEEYIAGREIQVSLADLGGDDSPTVLSFSEIAFKAAAAVRDRLNDTAKRAFRLLDCRDYARVDTRVTADGEVYVLELNPNPSITSVMIDEGLPSVGYTYDQFIGVVVRNAAARIPGPSGERRKRT
jgi:D-alanine-D-alanine ligase